MPSFNIGSLKGRKGWKGSSNYDWFYSVEEDDKKRKLKHLHLNADMSGNMVYLSYGGRLVGVGTDLFVNLKWYESYLKLIEDPFKSEAQWIKDNYK